MSTIARSKKHQSPQSAAEARLQRLLQPYDAATKQRIHTASYATYCAMLHTARQGHAPHTRQAVAAWEAAVHAALARVTTTQREEAE